MKIDYGLVSGEQDFDAWVCFQNAAQACLRENQPDGAVTVYREAATHLPREPQVWLAKNLTATD